MIGADDRGVLLWALLGVQWNIFDVTGNTLVLYLRPYLGYWVKDVTIITISMIRIQGQKT